MPKELQSDILYLAAIAERTSPLIYRTFILTFTSAVLCGLIAFVPLRYVFTTEASSPLPCLLLVDDDHDNPDVRPYCISTLDEVGATRDVLDVASRATRLLATSWATRWSPGSLAIPGATPSPRPTKRQW